ncbi:peroxiredoxin Q [Mycena albidolilacea]|uniref:thioredoxin-dependent peroxiredoxin n=1 Tax=Mycena albidolilacea TaxID=1033008 RepID=A0AAD7F5A1_9AGAR|nr:peroxiredoxin Q [Mycena albidolilacea]
MSHRTLIGKPASIITLPNYDGEEFTLTPGVKGPTVIFFYPKAGSYGCTKEACQFRDAIAEKDTYAPGKVELVGISPDPVEKQKAFVEKHKLTYPVLSDSKGEAAKAYGIGKGMFGFAGVARTTIIIDAKGTIRDTLEGTLNYGAHSKFVTKWLDKLEAEEKEKSSAAAPTLPEPAAPTEAETEAPAEPAA